MVVQITAPSQDENEQPAAALASPPALLKMKWPASPIASSINTDSDSNSDDDDDDVESIGIAIALVYAALLAIPVVGTDRASQY